MKDFDKSQSQTEKEKFQAVKGPDFVSRLKGYINILGPDPQGQNTNADPDYIIRRAILLRSLLELHAPQFFERPESKGRMRIDPGVLHAFLKINEYKHGTRSIETIIAMSLLKGKERFERSSLPLESQLNIHVDGRTFLTLVQNT